MLYVYTGDNISKRKEALNRLLKTHTGCELFYITGETFDPEVFANFISGGDLFSNRYTVVVDSIIDTDEGDIVLGKVSEMKKSTNVFVVLENAILKDATITLKKAAEEFETFDLPKSAKPKLNIFSITDSFGARDKKSTWVLFQKALREGVAAEEVLNILIWQTKNLLFVKRSADMKSTGLSAFVYNKSKQYSANYKETELVDLSRRLASMFHDSHLGLELAPNLERYLLKTL